MKCKYLLPNNTQDDVAKIIKESLNALKADATLQGLLVLLKTNNDIALCQTSATSISVLCCSHSFTQDLMEPFLKIWGALTLHRFVVEFTSDKINFYQHITKLFSPNLFMLHVTFSDDLEEHLTIKIRRKWRTLLRKSCNGGS